jgi:hypothetical protein
MHVPGRCRLEHVRLVLRVLLVHMHVPGRCRLEHVRLVLRVLLKVGSGFTCTYLGAAASNTCDWCCECCSRQGQGSHARTWALPPRTRATGAASAAQGRVRVHMHVPGRCRLEHVRLVLGGGRWRGWAHLLRRHRLLRHARAAGALRRLVTHVDPQLLDLPAATPPSHKSATVGCVCQRGDVSPGSASPK